MITNEIELSCTLYSVKLVKLPPFALGPEIANELGHQLVAHE